MTTIALHLADTLSRYFEGARLPVEKLAPLIAKLEGRPAVETAALLSFGHDAGAQALDRVLAGALITDFAGGKRRQVEQRLLEVSLANS